MDNMYKYNPQRQKSYYYYKKPFYKKWWFITIVLIILIGLGFTTYALSRKNTSELANNSVVESLDATPKELTCMLTYINGTVSIKSGEQEWAQASQEIKLVAGDSLKTDKKSKAILEFSDGSILRLNENTEILIQEMSLEKIFIKQASGNTYSRVNKAGDILYKVFLPNAVYTATGTAFDLSASSEEQKISLIEGVAKFEQTDKDSQTVLMKNVESGKSGIFTLKTSNFEIKEIDIESLKTDWFQWNKNEDNKKYYSLGILEQVVGPKLEITEPQDNSTTDKNEIAIKGTTDLGVAIKINGEDTENINGTFSKTVKLVEGSNNIEIIALATDSAKTVKTITVKFAQNENTSDDKITLEVQANGADAKLSWEIAGIDSFEGFKIMKSLKENPTYPNDSYRFVTVSSSSYIWSDLENGTYHFRVCAFKNNDCFLYSNNASITIQKTNTTTSSGEIKLSGSSDEGKAYLTWAVKDLATGNGFKIVMSEKENPSYPKDAFHYLSDNTARNDVWSDLSAGKTYHFRVCQYIDSKCGIYSNDLSLKILEPSPAAAPTAVNLSGEVQSDGVHLSWTKNEDSDFKYYKVVKSTTNSSPKYPADGYIAVKNKGELSYIDTSVTPSKSGTFYYSVCVVNAQNQVSCSNVLKITNQ